MAFIHIYSECCCIHHPCLVPEHFHHPKRKPIPISNPSLVPLSPRIPGNHQVYFLSLWICLFCIFHTNGILWYVAFCDWLLLLPIMFSKLIHAIECIRTLLLFIVEEELVVRMYHFVFIHRETTFKDHLPCVNIVLKLNERKIQASTLTNAHRCPQSLAKFLFFTRKNISADFSHRIIWLYVSVTSRVWWCKRSPVPGSDDRVEFWFCYWANQGSSLRLSLLICKMGR